MLARDLVVDEISQQQVDEDDVRRIDEGHVLPALLQQRPIDSPQPHDGVARLQVAQSTAAATEELAEASQQLWRRGLDDGPLHGGAARRRNGRLVAAEQDGAAALVGAIQPAEDGAIAAQPDAVVSGHRRLAIVGQRGWHDAARLDAVAREGLREEATTAIVAVPVGVVVLDITQVVVDAVRQLYAVARTDEVLLPFLGRTARRQSLPVEGADEQRVLLAAPTTTIYMLHI